MIKILIVIFSATGNTAKIAEVRFLDRHLFKSLLEIFKTQMDFQAPP